MTDIELLPCPFCGGQPYMQSDSDVDGCYWSKVRCRSCGATTRGKWASSSDSTCPQWYAEVREEWNARAVAEHNVSRALAESDHSLRTENAGLALALEQAEHNVKERDAEIEALRSERQACFDQACKQADQRRSAESRAERLAEALRWYAEQAEGCRKIGSIGEPFRKELDRDGGKRARAALRDHDQEGKDG